MQPPRRPPMRAETEYPVWSDWTENRHYDQDHAPPRRSRELGCGRSQMIQMAEFSEKPGDMALDLHSDGPAEMACVEKIRGIAAARRVEQVVGDSPISVQHCLPRQIVFATGNLTRLIRSPLR